MSKRYLVLLVAATIISTGVAFAETTIQQIQSPIYTDDIGRSHFLGRGGYSSVRHIDMGAAQADAINEVSRDMQKVQKEVKETVNQVETDITNVIKERTDIPVSSKTRASFISLQPIILASSIYLISAW